MLLACRREMAAVAATPAPPEWQSWWGRAWQEEQEHGPRYRPAAWFARGDEPMPDRFRTRYLRAAHGLAGMGLVRIATLGGKLAFLRLTPSGERVAAALEAVPATEVTGE